MQQCQTTCRERHARRQRHWLRRAEYQQRRTGLGDDINIAVEIDSHALGVARKTAEVAAVLEGLRAAVQTADGSSASKRAGPPGQLTSRELELVRMSAQGMATSDLATALGLTHSTVKWYWQRIFAKLEVHRRFAAVKLARNQRVRVAEIFRQL